MSYSSGPIILDVNGYELDSEECEILRHPLVGGVILFARNYESPGQLSALCQSIRSASKRSIFITVDQEGGRVQRFRQGFTPLPAMRQLGYFYETNKEQALITAEACGWLMAAELVSVGVNLSFAPVLDLDRCNHSAIGDRAFHSQPSIVIELAKAFINGMHQVGMSATGKHFPGHGGVAPDSHKTMPVDPRSYDEINALDMQPFIGLIKEDLLDAIMPAHILFSKVDDQPVGFSQHWLQSVLRKKLQFRGVIVSDDLNMEGAARVGDHVERTTQALNAGCDFALLCNNRPAATKVLDRLPQDQYLLTNEKVKIMQGQPAFVSDHIALFKLPMWKEKNARVVKFVEHIQSILSAN